MTASVDTAIETPSDIARKCIELLRRGWTRVEPAVDSSGRQCPSWDHTRAVAWSTLGALSGCSGSEKVKMLLLGRLRVFAKTTISEWNMKPEVDAQAAISLYKRCIEDGNYA